MRLPSCSEMSPANVVVVSTVDVINGSAIKLESPPQQLKQISPKQRHHGKNAVNSEELQRKKVRWIWSAQARFVV